MLKKKNKILPDNIAPGLSHYGVMLPCTPVHYLIFEALKSPHTELRKDVKNWLNEIHSTILIVTSANSGSNPLVKDEIIAENELNSIADVIISYNRDIITRVDDSVLQIIYNAPFFIRRARGYVPTPIKLPHSIPCTLAVGGHLKNTFCITRDNEAFVSQHIGSLNNKATIDFFHETLNYLMQFLNVTPECVAHDLHPDFYTTQFAQNYGIPCFAIQHHHAHLASVAAEHNIDYPTIGLILDGYGYGINGEAWGGELLLMKKTEFTKLGSLFPLPQPGGDYATREPWRMAAAVLCLLNKSQEITQRFSQYKQAKYLADILQKNINSPLTSSCGRLFDAASALLGVCEMSHYEGQAAMQLESLVTKTEILGNGWYIENDLLNLLPTLNILTQCDAVTGANIFHGTLIYGLAEWIAKWVNNTAIRTILLSGGCFLNKILTEGLIRELNKRDIQAIIPRQLPPNDGGISLGQAWVAGRLLCV